MIHPLTEAAQTHDLRKFMRLTFPPEWVGIEARIIETGAVMSETPCLWAPRWSPIPPTRRFGADSLVTDMKTVFFRVHDCLHQLWGLPHPGGFSEDEFYAFKRAQMCGEVAVLTLTEFVFGKYLWEEYPELRPVIAARNAVPLLGTHLAGKSVEQLAMRLDDLLHKKSRPRWVRTDPIAAAFVDDYVPMLERDREMIDINWSAMDRANWRPAGAPKARFSPDLDGLELTIWMIRDFEHLLSSTAAIDEALAEFNAERRAKIVLPDGWVS